MKVETLLPLGKIDPGLRQPEKPLDVAKVAEDARVVEDLGYDALMVEETKDDPYIVMALAAQATTRLGLGTAVAIAFPRSPTVTAMSAWTLAKLSGGRFTLGLGSQVKGHIERRFGLHWSAAGPWMAEYVEAGEMPPDDAETSLSDSDRKVLLDWTGAALTAGADRSRRGLRRAFGKLADLVRSSQS